MARFPMSILYVFSDIIYLILYHGISYRKSVVRKNISESFPEKSLKEIKVIEKQFYHHLGDMMVETIKLLHISDSEMKKLITVRNYESVNKTLSEKKNVVLLLGHYGNWEYVQEIKRYFLSESYMATIYHPPKKKVWDDVFLQIRSRWDNHMLAMRKAPKILLNKNNMPWVCGFIADQRPSKNMADNHLMFLNHDTTFIYGPEEIGVKVGSDFFYLEMTRIKRGHYTITFHKLDPKDLDQPFPYTREFWRKFEKTIENSPAFWLWSHKRWKK